MRTRTRLLLAFLAVHALLSALAGYGAWSWFSRAQREQAEERARAVGRLVARGGFSLTPGVVERMQDLTGYRFRLLDGAEVWRPGTVQVAEGGRVVEIAYETLAFRAAQRDVLVGAGVLAGVGFIAFALVALRLARGFARPLELLAAAARRIGAGDLDATVPPAGTGEVAGLAADLERMRCQLAELDRSHRRAERMATLGTFTATIAHEVRNPLSAVRLAVQMHRRRDPEDQDLALVADELERLDLVVDQLLAFSRGMSVRRESCPLRPLAEGVLRLLERQATHAQVTLGLEGDATVQADPQRLRQLLMNLLVNAIQALHGKGGRVTVRLLSDGLAVEDDGPGVPPDLLPRLFEPFASGRAGGTGLGLHLARAVAEAHGARLVHEPRSPGACFRILGL